MPPKARKQVDPLQAKLYALPHIYSLVFNIIEPAMTAMGAILAIGRPVKFYNETLPSTENLVMALTPRIQLIVRQLGSCYFLLGLISLCSLSAIRKAVPHDAVAQERLVGGLLTALAIADLTHAGLSLLGMPLELVLDPLKWNELDHGNVTVTLSLFLCRMAWFAGIGRTSYYYRVQGAKVKET